MSDITKYTSYDQISELDPLSFDAAAERLPSLNAVGHVGEIATEYSRLITLADSSLPNLNRNQATAALRDLDFVAGSLIRHGATDIAQEDNAQHVLTELGKKADTVPRGTVYTYAAGNPKGSRTRTFTGSEGELLFINAVRDGIDHLDECMDNVTAGAQGDTLAIESAILNMQGMVDSMIRVKRGITPEFFTQQMRPYFDAVQIDGSTYAGAGGAQMQMIAIDRMLWGVDSDSEVYHEYFEDNVRYLTPDHRQAITDFERTTEGHSLITLIEKGELSPDTILPMRGLLKTVRKFRYPHRKVARDNFAIRNNEAVGSGQYTVSILDQLVDLNEEAAYRLESMYVEE